MMVSFFWACSKDSDTKSKEKVKISFLESTVTAKENAGTYQIKVVFEKEYNGEIKYEAVKDDITKNIAENGTHFTITGITQVSGKEALIEVTLINDNDKNENREIYIDLIEGEGYEIAKIGRCKLIIINDDLNSLDPDHPLKHLQGSYIATVVHKTDDSKNMVPKDKDGNNWNITVEADNEDYGVFYLTGIRNTTTKLTCEVSEDGTYAKINYETPIVNAYSDLALPDGTPLKGAESPLVSVLKDENGQDAYADVIIKIKDNQLYIEHLVIGARVNGKTYLVHEVEVTMDKQ